jgi:polysaccharide biosynthesis transport protein
LGVEMQNPAPKGVANDQIDLRELSRMLFRQRWVFLAVVVGVLAVTVFVTLRMPRIYEASTSLEYDPTPASPLGSEIEDVASTSGSYLAGKEWFQTQNTIIASQTIARRVVDRLGLHRSADFMGVGRDERARWKGADPDDAAQKLRGQLTIKQERDTRVVRISVEDTDRTRAALLANAVADSYMDWMMEQRLGSTVRAVEWLSGQLDDVTKRLTASERDVYDFLRENNVLSLSVEDQQNNVTQTLHHLSSSLADATAKRIVIEAKLHQLESGKANPMDVPLGVVGESPSLAAVRRQYYDALVNRDMLAVKFGPNHPEVQRMQVQTDGLVKAANDELKGMVAVARGELKEIQEVEEGLKRARQKAQNMGLDLTLREIDYKRLQRETANNEKLHTLLLQRTAETNLTRMLRVMPVRLVDRAMVPKAPVRPKTFINIMVGLVGGVLAGIALAGFRVRLDRSVGVPHDIIDMGETVLGIVPGIVDARGGVPRNSYSRRRVARRSQGARTPLAEKDLVVHHHPRSAAAECCRTIRTNLAFMSTETPLRAFVVTSPGPAEGKSTLAVSLGITIANSGKRVLLVDTDLRRPRIHKAFSVPSRLGITSVLLGEENVDQCIQSTLVDGLSILPCGPIPPNPAELLHTAKFSRLLEELKSKFDIVMLDSPPVGVVIDAAIIGPQVDGAIIVSESGSTNREALIQALRQMRDVGTKILGCVLNNVDLAKETGYGGYYYYRPGYYSDKSDEPVDPDDNSGDSPRISRPTPAST